MLKVSTMGIGTVLRVERDAWPITKGLIQATSAWSLKTRRAPFRHCRDARVYGHTTIAKHGTSTPPPPGPLHYLCSFTIIMSDNSSLEALGEHFCLVNHFLPWEGEREERVADKKKAPSETEKTLSGLKDRKFHIGHYLQHKTPIELMSVLDQL